MYSRDPTADAAAKVTARLAARAEEDAWSSTAVLAPPPPPRLPSAASARRQILEAIARVNGKYARPFDQGTVALASLIDTESWAGYGDAVLQMAILGTLLSIEKNSIICAKHRKTTGRPSARRSAAPILCCSRRSRPGDPKLA
jgi:hypothetical protein